MKSHEKVLNLASFLPKNEVEPRSAVL